MTEPLRVVSYNIHGAIGSDGRYDPARVASLLEPVRADAIALQEVVHREAEGRDLLDYLARRLGMHPVPGPTLLGPLGVYGNALLVRGQPVEIRRLDISVPGREPRGIVCTRMRLHGLHVWLMNTHLGLRHRERLMQVRRIADFADTLRGAVVMLLGDFNDWRPRRFGALAPLRRCFRDEIVRRTYPSHRPMFPLDRVFLRGRYAAAHGRLIRETGAAQPSDHLPLQVTLELPAPGSAEEPDVRDRGVTRSDD